MRHTVCAFLSSMLLLSMLTYITIFSHHALAASKVASRYISTVVLERRYSRQGHFAQSIKAVNIYRLNNTSSNLIDANVYEFYGYFISFRPSMSTRHSPKIPALQAKWPDTPNGRGKNNATGYELGV